MFLERDGGVGGSDVIWVSDPHDDRDLYLWLDSDPAPSADYVFVAAVRTDIPQLLSSLDQST